MRFLLPLLALTLASGCSLTGPGDPRDPLDAMLISAYEEVPAFGGVRFSPGDGADEGYQMTVFTLGEDPDAEAAIHARLWTHCCDGTTGAPHYDVAPRPAQGSATPELAEQMRGLLPSDYLAEVAFDASIGYVRISCGAASHAGYVSRYLEREGISQENVLIQVVDR